MRGQEEIKYKGYTIVFDDYVNGYVIYNNRDEDATAGWVFKSINQAKQEIDLGTLAYPNDEFIREEEEEEELIRNLDIHEAAQFAYYGRETKEITNYLSAKEDKAAAASHLRKSIFDFYSTGSHGIKCIGDDSVVIAKKPEMLKFLEIERGLCDECEDEETVKEIDDTVDQLDDYSEETVMRIKKLWDWTRLLEKFEEDQE